jgi:hypothetical protein
VATQFVASRVVLSSTELVSYGLNHYVLFAFRVILTVDGDCSADQLNGRSASNVTTVNPR